ncbi:MAG: carboxylesterase family protein, partial [Deltaproteobacteria bacterium]|nr:carboxylesterase family protein [Deltaproteobacteria bacterium]
WTPKAASSSRLPVMVYIHGGGNAQGSTSKEQLGTRLYDGAQMAERGDAVVVTIQYRLGPMGFLVLSELAAESTTGSVGNYGLRDQILALRWVQRHAARFGGDPSKVLLFGESAGAVNTCMHLVSPLSAGLFSRALMESGACVASTRAERETEGLDFLRQMGCDATSNRLACLRALPAETLVSLLGDPLKGGIAQMAFGPTIDGDVLPDAPISILKAGEQNKVPFVIGSNADEMAIVVPPLSIAPATMLALISEFPQAFRQRLLALYPPGTTKQQARESYIRATTDAQFTCMARRIARAAQATQTEPVYRYYFTRKMPGPLADTFGAFHGLELYYVFQALERSSIATFADADDLRLSARMLAYWTRLAESGNPNGGTDPLWTTYDVTTDPAILLDATSSMVFGVRSMACDLWDEIGASVP